MRFLHHHWVVIFTFAFSLIVDFLELVSDVLVIELIVLHVLFQVEVGMNDDEHDGEGENDVDVFEDFSDQESAFLYRSLDTPGDGL